MRFITGIIGSVLLAGCTQSAAPQPPVAATAACSTLGNEAAAMAAIFAPGNAYAAHPAIDRGEIMTGRAGAYTTPVSDDDRVGAELYVHATPGNTGEYLQRTLECYTASAGSRYANDPFHPTVGSVTDVDVRSAGDSFIVRIEGDGEAAGAAILRSARAMVSEPRVTIEQVSNVTTRQSTD